MMVPVPRVLVSSPSLAREWRGGLNSRPACLVHTIPQVRQDPPRDRVQPLHSCPSVLPERSTRETTWIAIPQSKHVKWSLQTWLA